MVGGVVNPELNPPVSPAEWDAFHSIREAALWRERGVVGGYDRDHPDDVAAGNHPLLLTDAGRPVGVVRVDIDGDVAYLRRVAVVAEMRGRGYGRTLLSLAEQFASLHGVVQVHSNVDAGAVGFYRRAGYVESGPALADGGIPMQKRI
jgi:GNAT superfamily N-acetyltransferase